jgi:hypothetical protein
MTVYEWLYNKLATSTSLSTTAIYPDYMPLGEFGAPGIVYSDISFTRNRTIRTSVLSLKSFHNSKSGVENLNTQLYDMFDNTYKYIRESSSKLHVINVYIANNAVGGYDDTSNIWWRALDIQVNYYLST